MDTYTYNPVRRRIYSLLRDGTAILEDSIQRKGINEQSLAIGRWSLAGDSILLELGGQRATSLLVTDSALSVNLARHPAVDLFDVLEQASASEGYDETAYLYYLARDQRKKKFAVVFDQDATRDKYLKQAQYSHNPLKLEERIRRVADLYASLDTYLGYVARYEQPRTRMEAEGTWPPSDFLFGEAIPEDEKRSKITYDLQPCRCRERIRGIGRGRLRNHEFRVDDRRSFAGGELVVGKSVRHSDSIASYILEVELAGKESVERVNVKYNSLEAERW